MANLCYFEMKVNGQRENIKKFYNALIQSGTTWMGRGADADIDYDNNCAYIHGNCKWSMKAAFINDAVSMRTNPKMWYKLNTTYEYITLWEACEKWNLEMEAYSEESGMCFQEHLMYDEDGIIDEWEEWHDYCLDDFETKEEAEKEFGIKITDSEWEDKEFIYRGGFGEWIFAI